MYPDSVLARRSVIDCPVHPFTVALGDDGRIASRCPGCRREAQLVLERWRGRRRRRLAVA